MSSKLLAILQLMGPRRTEEAARRNQRRESPSTLTLVAVQNPIRATPVGRPIHTIWNTSVRLPSRRCASLDCNGAAPCRRRDPFFFITPAPTNISPLTLLRLFHI